MEIKTDKLPGRVKILCINWDNWWQWTIDNYLGHDHAADHIFVGMPEGKQKL